MMNNRLIDTTTIRELMEKYPFVINYFSNNKLNIEGYENHSFKEYLNHFTDEEIEEWAIDTVVLMEGLLEYINQMAEFLGIEEDKGVESLTILAGKDKSGNREGFEEITINRGEIISIVGPTGSGKSRLLADIEWAAQNDTPTGRSILINNEVPDKDRKASCRERV